MAKIYFTSDHEWLRVDNGVATVGITNHAQEQLGDLVFIELPEKGASFAKGDVAVVVESVKAASDVYAPVDGEILAVNDRVAAEPALVNTAAESEGWLFTMKLTDASQLDGLLDRAGYQATL